MNASIRYLTIAFLALSTATAFASTDIVQVPATTISGATDAIAAARVVLTSPDQDAAYALSNKRSLTIEQFGPSMHIRYGKRRMTVRYDGSGNFVSTDGLLRLRFGLSGDGNPDTVSLSVPAAWQ